MALLKSEIEEALDYTLFGFRLVCERVKEEDFLKVIPTVGDAVVSEFEIWNTLHEMFYRDRDSFDAITETYPSVGAIEEMFYLLTNMMKAISFNESSNQSNRWCVVKGERPSQIVLLSHISDSVNLQRFVPRVAALLMAMGYELNECNIINYWQPDKSTFVGQSLINDWNAQMRNKGYSGFATLACLAPGLIGVEEAIRNGLDRGDFYHSFVLWLREVALDTMKGVSDRKYNVSVPYEAFIKKDNKNGHLSWFYEAMDDLGNTLLMKSMYKPENVQHKSKNNRVTINKMTMGQTMEVERILNAMFDNMKAVLPSFEVALSKKSIVSSDIEGILNSVGVGEILTSVLERLVDRAFKGEGKTIIDPLSLEDSNALFYDNRPSEVVFSHIAGITVL